MYKPKCWCAVQKFVSHIVAVKNNYIIENRLCRAAEYSCARNLFNGFFHDTDKHCVKVAVTSD
jgi:hypothetical protein